MLDFTEIDIAILLA